MGPARPRAARGEVGLNVGVKADPNILVAPEMAPGWDAWPLRAPERGSLEQASAEGVGVKRGHGVQVTETHGPPGAMKKSVGRPLGCPQNQQDTWRDQAWEKDRNQERQGSSPQMKGVSQNHSCPGRISQLSLRLGIFPSKV